MKKQLLISTGIFVSGLLCAQVASKAPSKIPANLAKISVKKTKVTEDYFNSAYVSGTRNPKASTPNNLRTSSLSENVIGTTYYDLQTNSSVGDRLVVNADNSIAAVWTFEGTADGGVYANRGTGYAYYNGSVWSSAPTTRVETSRVGWGNIVNTRSGRELILSHDGSASSLKLSSRATKGTGAWAESLTAVPSATTGGNFWPRMVNSGDTIYSISLTYPTPTGAMFAGLNGAVVFSRSKNAGVTWDIVNQIPAGLTSSTFRGFGGDSYAIASKGATVVVVAGDSDKDLVMSKSTDAGATWTSKTVLRFPLPLWDPTTTTSDINADGVADTIDVCDGNLSVALDNSGKAFVAYGGMRILNDAPSATGYSYFPYTDGLYLWNETMPVNVGGNLVASIQDLGEQGTIYFPTPASGSLAFGRWGCSLTSYPSMAFDASNNLYLAYSSIVDSLISVSVDQKLVRNVYVQKSTNGGLTFGNPLDVVTNLVGVPFEGIFPSMAKKVNGFVHLIYQKDLYPGNGIPATSGTNPDQADNLDKLNDIVYVKIPVADLDNVPIPNGVKELNETISNLSFYPNPASVNATIEVTLVENTKMDVVILNSVGQVISSKSVNGFVGDNKVSIDLSSLSSGMYFYQVKTNNNKSVTKKFAVSK